MLSKKWFLHHVLVSCLVVHSAIVHTLPHVPFEEIGKQWQPEFLVWVSLLFSMLASLLGITNAVGFGLIGTFSIGMRYPFFLCICEAISSSTWLDVKDVFERCWPRMTAEAFLHIASILYWHVSHTAQGRPSFVRTLWLNTFSFFFRTSPSRFLFLFFLTKTKSCTFWLLWRWRVLSLARKIVPHAYAELRFDVWHTCPARATKDYYGLEKFQSQQGFLLSEQFLHWKKYLFQRVGALE